MAFIRLPTPCTPLSSGPHTLYSAGTWLKLDSLPHVSYSVLSFSVSLYLFFCLSRYLYRGIKSRAWCLLSTDYL
jgi:hypothetical protein